MELIKEIRGSEDFKGTYNPCKLIYIEGKGRHLERQLEDKSVRLENKDNRIFLSQGDDTNNYSTHILDGGVDEKGNVRPADGIPDDFGIDEETKLTSNSSDVGADLAFVNWMSGGKVGSGGGNEGVRLHIAKAISGDNKEIENLQKEIGIKPEDLKNLMRVYIERLTVVRDEINKERIEKADKALEDQIKQQQEKENSFSKFRNNIK